MPFFKLIDSFNTYDGHGSDFHYDYNANSGGGQAFLGGSFADDEGTLHSAKELEGKSASFLFRYHSDDGALRLVDLGADVSAQFDVTPRSSGNQNMKLALENKTRPSLLFPALLMLPRTCGRNMADSLNRSPLTLDNYWLRSMWLDVTMDDSEKIRFIPKDYVFEGGSSKKKGVSDGKTVVGKPSYFELDYERRANDIIRVASCSSVFPNDIAEVLCYFDRLLTGDGVFSYETCSTMTQDLMSSAARCWPELYSGISDPLPLLMKMAGCREGSSLVASKRSISEPRNLIYFGAPGTGKSYELNKLAEKCFPENNVTRVTFYPDYAYSQFVGCFKPMTEPAVGEDAKGLTITYRYVFGPFLKTYVEACKQPDQNYLLIVEEINRANPAAVFGDVFQLLDRRPDGRSEYSVATPEEMRAQLTCELGENAFDVSRLAIPSNMYIWATMNSADQGVFPMDTAFKRRWDFRYMGIDEGEDADIDGTPLSKIKVLCGNRKIVWNDLRHAINQFMLSDDLRVNEDKLLGPFFIAPSALRGNRFNQMFKDKVLLYLYEDAGKMKRSRMFRHELKIYSEICDYFDEHGEGVFGQGFDDHFVFESDDAEDNAAAEA